MVVVMPYQNRKMAATEPRKTIGKSAALLFWFAFLGSTLLQFTTGGVVVEKKYDKGEYFFILREQPSVWIETDAFIYYLNFVEPWFHGVVLIILFTAFIKNYCKDIFLQI